MRRPPSIFLAIVAVIAGFLLLGTLFGAIFDGGGWRHDDNRITIVNPDSGSGSGSSSSGVTVDGKNIAPGSVVVIDNGRRGFGFFPFFPIFPLLFLGFLFFLFTRGRRFRGGGDCDVRGRGARYGPGRWDNRPDGHGSEGPSRYTESPEHAWFNREATSPAPSPASTPQPTNVAPASQPAPDAPTSEAPAPQSGSASQS